MSSTESDITTQFALSRAQQILATEPQDFTLGFAGAPELQLRVRIDPMGESSIRGQTATSFQRSVQTLQNQQQTAEMSAVTYVNLETGQLVANVGAGVFAVAQNAKPLPELASIGEHGPYFESHAFADSACDGSPIITQVTWSLESWAAGQALWCIHVHPQAGGGIESAEAYAIESNGTIVGAAIRAWARPPEETKIPDNSPTRDDGKRLIQWRTARPLAG